MSLICLTMVDFPLSPAPSIKALTVRLESGQHSGQRTGIAYTHSPPQRWGTHASSALARLSSSSMALFCCCPSEVSASIDCPQPISSPGRPLRLELVC